MSFQIGDAIEQLQLETQTVGVRISDSDFILAFNRADEYFRTAYKMPTTERLSDLLVFSGVYEYPAPSDFEGWSEPMRPYGNVSPWFVNTTSNELVHTYAGKQTAFRFDRENQFLIVSDPGMAGNSVYNGAGTSMNSNVGTVNINSCDSLTDNGTWSISGDGSNLILDTQIFVEGSGSLRFNITDSTGTTVLTCVNQNPVDLSQYIQQGYFFLNLECPSSNTVAVSQVKLRLSSTAGLATNYYEFTSTTRYRGDSIKNSWGAIGFNALDATTVGSPDSSNLIYMTVTISNGLLGTTGIYRLDAIFGALPTYYQLPYYSNTNFKTNAGLYITQATSTSDTVLCPLDCEGAYRYKALEWCAVNKLQDQGLANYAFRELQPKEQFLKSKYAATERKVQNQWYRSPIAF